MIEIDYHNILHIPHTSYGQQKHNPEEPMLYNDTVDMGIVFVSQWLFQSNLESSS